MKTKHVLRVTQPFSKDIIALSDNNNQYVDHVFYHKKMGENLDVNSSSFPVNIVYLRVGWIVYDDKTNSMSRQGHKLL